MHVLPEGTRQRLSGRVMLSGAGGPKRSPRRPPLSWRVAW